MKYNSKLPPSFYLLLIILFWGDVVQAKKVSLDPPIEGLFEFTEIANDSPNGDFSLFRNSIIINNLGHVAFMAVPKNPNNFADWGVYKSSDLGIQTIFAGDANQLFPRSNTSFPFGINDNGKIVFQAILVNTPPANIQEFMYLGDENSVTRILEVSSINPNDVAYLYDYGDINNAGEIAYLTNSGSLIITDGIFHTPIAQIPAPIPFNPDNTATAFNGPVINDLGEILISVERSPFRVLKFDRNGNEISYSSPLFTLPVLNPGYQLGFNNHSNIAFTTLRLSFSPTPTFEESGKLIFIMSEDDVADEIAQQHILIDTNDGLFERFASNASLNNFNQIAFQAGDLSTGGTDGLYLVDTSGGRAKTIVRKLYEINGKTILNINGSIQVISSDFLNDNGEMSFSAGVYDNTTGQGYNAIFKVGPKEGTSPGNPFPPETENNEACENQVTITDPITGMHWWWEAPYSTGFDYSLPGSAPSFESVMIPAILPGGDQYFEIEFNGFVETIRAAVPFYFTDFIPEGVRSFRITGIEIDDENFPEDFSGIVTGASFLSDGDYPFEICTKPLNNSQSEVLVIDEESIKSDNPPNYFNSNDINEDRAKLGQRKQLRYFDQNVGETLTLHTGEVGDEGWFALTVIPNEWNNAGPTEDGLHNYVGITQPDGKIKVGKGLGRGNDPEKYLDKIPGVTPLRATGLNQLVGKTICAVVQKSDVSINYDPLDGSLKGDSLGRVAFQVLSVSELTGYSSSSLPKVEIEILNADEICEGELKLFTDAPEIESSSEPFDVKP